MKRVLLMAALAATSGAAWAEGMSIEPGKWEIRTLMSLPMMPEPQAITMSECINESEITPESLNRGSASDACTFDVTSSSSSSMQWATTCQMEGSSMTGVFDARSEGSTFSGNGAMTMAMAGQNMEMTVTWTGERIGDCDSQ